MQRIEFNVSTGVKRIINFTAQEEAEQNAKTALVLAEQAPTAYQRQRAFEYPPIADYLDGIVKGDTEIP